MRRSLKLGIAGLGIAALAAALWLGVPRRLDVRLDQPQTIHRVWSGTWRYAWVDGDAWPDVTVTLSDGGDSWAVLSTNGRILHLRVK